MSLKKEIGIQGDLTVRQIDDIFRTLILSSGLRWFNEYSWVAMSEEGGVHVLGTYSPREDPRLVVEPITRQDEISDALDFVNGYKNDEGNWNDLGLFEGHAVDSFMKNIAGNRYAYNDTVCGLLVDSAAMGKTAYRKWTPLREVTNGMRTAASRMIRFDLESGFDRSIEMLRKEEQLYVVTLYAGNSFALRRMEKGLYDLIGKK